MGNNILEYWNDKDLINMIECHENNIKKHKQRIISLQNLIRAAKKEQSIRAERERESK